MWVGPGFSWPDPACRAYDRFMKVPLLLGFLAIGTAYAAELPTIDPEEALARQGPIERGDDADIKRLVGTKAPALPQLRWLDGQPRTLASLEGKVVVVRMFTNECPFCAATVPVSTKIPVPMIAPIPSMVRFVAPRARFKRWSVAASA